MTLCIKCTDREAEEDLSFCESCLNSEGMTAYPHIRTSHARQLQHDLDYLLCPILHSRNPYTPREPKGRTLDAPVESSMRSEDDVLARRFGETHPDK